MVTIWKFMLDIRADQTVKIPATFKILSLQVQYGVPCIWALVDTISPDMDIEIQMYGTGQQIEHVGNYIGTVIVDSLVWHFYYNPSKRMS